MREILDEVVVHSGMPVSGHPGVRVQRRRQSVRTEEIMEVVHYRGADWVIMLMMLTQACGARRRKWKC
jgi:hypothetical protein